MLPRWNDAAIITMITGLYVFSIIIVIVIT